MQFYCGCSEVGTHTACARAASLDQSRAAAATTCAQWPYQLTTTRCPAQHSLTNSEDPSRIAACKRRKARAASMSQHARRTAKMGIRHQCLRVLRAVDALTSGVKSESAIGRVQLGQRWRKRLSIAGRKLLVQNIVEREHMRSLVFLLLEHKLRKRGFGQNHIHEHRDVRGAMFLGCLLSEQSHKSKHCLREERGV